jgi:hypothetical protein
MATAVQRERQYRQNFPISPQPSLGERVSNVMCIRLYLVYQHTSRRANEFNVTANRINV